MRSVIFVSRGRWLHCWTLVILAAAICSAEEPTVPSREKTVLQVELQLMEVQTGKLKKMGFAWSHLASDGVKEASFAEFLESIKKSKSADQLDGFLESLKQNGLATTLAEPTLATLNGRPASLAVGTTQLDMVPILLGNGDVRLECRLKINPTPDNELLLHTTMQLEPGQKRFVFHAPRKPPAASDKVLETEMLFLAKVEVLEAGARR